MQAFSLTKMIVSHNMDIYLLFMAMLSIGRVSNKRQSQIQQLKKSTNLHLKQQKKQFGSRSSSLNFVWFLALLIQYLFIVTTMKPLHKQKNQVSSLIQTCT
uniref:Transmembrane protein n=1 Tax=Rhizophora mucronata TaxID=61149 RepID=A0A2P2QNY5_RHIMU